MPKVIEHFGKAQHLNSVGNGQFSHQEIKAPVIRRECGHGVLRRIEPPDFEVTWSAHLTQCALGRGYGVWGHWRRTCFISTTQPGGCHLVIWPKSTSHKGFWIWGK